MDYRKQGLLPPESTSTLQKLKDRARSVDRYFSEQKLNLLGQGRGSSQESDVPGTASLTSSSSSQDVRTRPDHRSRLTASTNLLNSNNNGHDLQRGLRGRSPSINLRIQQNLQNLVGYLFERKNDGKKRVLAEKLLWTAARRNEVTLMRDILKQLSDPSFDINAPNEFGWNLIDDTIMLGNFSIAVELFKSGARETQALSSKNVRTDFLRKAIRRLEAEQLVARQNEKNDVATRPSIHNVQQMLQNVEKMRPPRNALDSIRAEIWDENAVALIPSHLSSPSGIITRFKVEWSPDRHFNSSVDYEIFTDAINPPRFIIDNLKNEQKYYFRVSAGNMAGFGTPLLAQPFPVQISSWREVHGLPQRFDQQTEVDLEELLQKVESLESSIKFGVGQHGLARMSMGNPGLARVAGVQRRPSLKDSIKSILKVQPRLNGFGDEGLFLGCLLTCGDTFLFTSDYTLPVVVVQHSPTERIGAKDFLWLQKLTSCWPLVQPLKELLSSSRETASDLRYNILQAIIGLQSSFALEDLGNLYLRPLINKSSGTLLLLLIKQLDNPDEFRTPAFKWLHSKEVELMNMGGTNQILSLVISAGLKELSGFSTAVQSQLEPGLHLGFLQLKFDLEQVSLMTTKKQLTSLPSHKMADNCHITRHDWESLIKPASNEPSRLQHLMRDSWETIKHNMSLRVNDESLHIHEEVLQLAPRTSMIVTFAQKRDLGSRASFDDEKTKGMVYNAVQTFEANYYAAHRKDAWSNYCQSFLILEALFVHVTQFHRQNMPTSTETTAIKMLQAKIRQHQDELDKIWNPSRWLPDLIRAATNRNAKRISLFPKEPSFTAGIKSPPVKPPRNSTKVTIQINDEPLDTERQAYDNVATTVVIRPRTPDRGTVNIETDDKTTAGNVIHTILSRSMSPVIVPNVARSYSLVAREGDNEKHLPHYARIKDVIETKPQTRFVLEPRKTV